MENVVMLTRMEFKFSEEKCKEYGVTLIYITV